MTQVRRVRRIIRKFDAWTVFRVSLVVWLIIGIGLVLGLVMFWSVLQASGIPQKLTDFLTEITLIEQGTQPFSNSEQFLRLAVFGSMVVAVLGTGFTTLLAVMYNLVSDVVGGIEVVVLEETLVAPSVGAPVIRPTATNGNGRTADYDLPTEETPIAARR